MDFERVAIVGPEPAYSPYGYVITEDGTIYSLTRQYTHGVILAMLYPEEAAEAGYDPVDEDYNVFEYQAFELDNHERFPVVRIALGMMYSFNVSKGDMPATEAQINAVTKILKCQDKSLNDTCQTDTAEMTVRKMLELLRLSGDDAFDARFNDPKPTTVKKPIKGLSDLAKRYDD